MNMPALDKDLIDWMYFIFIAFLFYIFNRQKQPKSKRSYALKRTKKQHRGTY